MLFVFVLVKGFGCGFVAFYCMIVADLSFCGFCGCFDWLDLCRRGVFRVGGFGWV